jgi:hypothetical protein
LQLWNGWRFLKGFLACCTWCRDFIFSKFLSFLISNGWRFLKGFLS